MSNSAGPILEHTVQGRVHHFLLSSVALGRPEPVYVVTPPDWSPDTERLPVLFFLHGADDTLEESLAKSELVEKTANSRLLLVCPSGGRIGLYSQWTHPERDENGNDLAVPDWESFHLREVPAALFERFNASNTWGVAGVSMGAVGAIGYAARNPGLFTAAAALSGIASVTSRVTRSLLGLALRSMKQRKDAVWGDYRHNRETWAAHDPFLLAERLRGTEIYLACGDGTHIVEDRIPRLGATMEGVLRRTTTKFSARLDEVGVEHTFSVSPGGHNWPLWRREFDTLIPWFDNAFSARQNKQATRQSTQQA